MDTTSSANNSSTFGMTNNADNALNKASSGVHSAVNSVAQAADEMAGRAKPAIDRAAAMAHHAVDKAAGAAAPTAEWLSEKGASIRGTEKKLVADTCSYVAANPLKSLGIAVAAGVVISLLVRK